MISLLLTLQSLIELIRCILTFSIYVFVQGSSLYISLDEYCIFELGLLSVFKKLADTKKLAPSDSVSF
jgi:hypothetical protein